VSPVGRNNRRALRRFWCEERPAIRDPCAARVRHAVSLVAHFIWRNARWLLRPRVLAAQMEGRAAALGGEDQDQERRRRSSALQELSEQA